VGAITAVAAVVLPSRIRLRRQGVPPLPISVLPGAVLADQIATHADALLLIWTRYSGCDQEGTLLRRTIVWRCKYRILLPVIAAWNVE
jgi:hypothetical protein